EAHRRPPYSPELSRSTAWLDWTWWVCTPSAHYTKGLPSRSPKAAPTLIAMYVALLLEWSMQRLLGTFPNRSAGLALLILRLAVAAALVTGAGLCPGRPETEVLLGLSRIAAVLIMVGWYTPLAAISAVLVSLCTFWVCREPGVNALMIAILIAIGLLG